MSRRSERIRAIWDEIEADEPDISTPQLFARTGDLYFMRFNGDIDDGDIASALAETQPAGDA